MTSEEPGGGYAKRRAATDRKIIDAVIVIIQDDGVDAVTIDEVVERSGVAKTTIYRRYANRYELLAEASKELVPDRYVRTDYTFEGVVETLDEFRRIYDEHIGWWATARALATDSEFVADFREKIMETRFDSVYYYLRQGVKLGHFRKDINEAMVRQVTVGAMIYSSSREGVLSEDWARELVTILWPYLTGEIRDL